MKFTAYDIQNTFPVIFGGTTPFSINDIDNAADPTIIVYPVNDSPTIDTQWEVTTDFPLDEDCASSDQSLTELTVNDVNDNGIADDCDIYNGFTVTQLKQLATFNDIDYVCSILNKI